MDDQVTATPKGMVSFHSQCHARSLFFTVSQLESIGELVDFSMSFKFSIDACQMYAVYLFQLEGENRENLLTKEIIILSEGRIHVIRHP